MNKLNANKPLHQEEPASPWMMLPFLITLIVIPFVMGLYQFNNGNGSEYFQVYSNTKSSVDIFLYYKSFYLTIMGAILALVFVTYRFMTKRPFSFGIAMIPLYVYLGCIILSTLYSTSMEHSLHGIQHHFESCFVLLTYCMLVMYAAYFTDNERCINWFFNGFLIGTLLLALFGSIQFCAGIFNIEKMEPFKTQFMADYIYWPVNKANGKLSLNFPLGQVYMTLYNPNYVAYFTTLTAPFFALMAFFQKKLWKKIVCAVVAAASIFCLIGSRSVTGFLALFVSLFVLILAFRKKIFAKWKVWLCAVGVFAAALLVFDFASGHAALNRLNYVWEKMTASMEKGYHNETSVGLRNLVSSEKGIKIEYLDSTAYFTMDYDVEQGITCAFKDENGAELATKTTTDSDGRTTITLTENGFQRQVADAETKKTVAKDAIHATYSEALPGVIYLPICTLEIDGNRWIFTNQIHTASYSYNTIAQSQCSNSNCGHVPENQINPPAACPVCGSAIRLATPFTVMQIDTHPDVGTYYSYADLPLSSAAQLFQSFATDLNSLQNCFTHLATVNSDYATVGNQILQSDNPSQAAQTYFSGLLQDADQLYAFFFYLTQSSDIDEHYYYYNQVGKWTQIGSEPNTALFDSYPKLASNRGFIWSRTIPILFRDAHTFLIGTGPDTFVLNYPHYDYVNLFRVGFAGQIITKPHSLYLQIGVQTGFISMIAVLALYFLYLISCIRLYWKSRFDTLTSQMSAAILASVSGYMFAGITNDSTVTYSFVFWSLMGVGIAVNRLERRNRVQAQEAEERRAKLEQQRLEREAKKKKRQSNNA